MTVILLSTLAFLSSAISATTGMAGGVLLLSSLSLILSPAQLIPIHGLAQLTSNSFRVSFLLKHIIWSTFVKFALAACLGALIGALMVDSISTQLLYILLALLIIFSLFRSKLPIPKLTAPWSLIGLIAGTLGILVGSVGPFLAVFYSNEQLSKEQIVANKSIMQLFCHLLKLPVFLGLGFNYFEHLQSTFALIVAGMFGTYVGIKLLNKVSENIFRLIFKSLLLIAAIRLLYQGAQCTPSF